MWYPGYVSEAGVPGEPYARFYRAGLILLSIAMGALAVAVFTLTRGIAAAASRADPTSPAGRIPVGLVRLVALAPLPLGVAGLLGLVSGSVSCTPGCPLPPRQPAVVSDVVHGGASILAVGLVGVSVVLLALLPRPRVWSPTLARLCRLCRGTLIVLVPAGIASAYTLVALGRGYPLGITERLALLVELLWMLAAGWLLARPGTVRTS
jgi:hypothetical protein